MNIQDLHKIFLSTAGVVIDTRKISKNSLFIAIKGDRFDANLFANEALDLGASFVLIDNENCFIDERTILVNDTLKTLQELAKYHRQYLKIPIVALTGSNGKTTTKELIHIVLSKKFRTKSTIGNLNNHIGVPLTLLSFTHETEIGIVEMGANHQKEIEFLCDLAEPDYGYITNFGKAHLEGFGGIEGVIIGKSEMYIYLRKNHKKVFINADDMLQVEKSKGIDAIGFSLVDRSSFVFIDEILSNPLVTISFESESITSHLIGIYNANNINVAIAIGKYFGVATSDIKAAIESYVPENNRSQLITKGSNEIILDAYNANPSSMKVALENFIQLEKTNKIAIIGDMFELGAESNTEHRLVIESLLNQYNLECYFVGHEFYNVKLGQKNFMFFKSFEEFKIYFEQQDIQNSMLLIKGSRGMALERTMEFI